ncbi:MAG: glycosyltransferase [Vicinamibacteraceae bacterium]
MTPPRIFYFAYSHQRPTGGQKHTYRHVDILTSHGYEAYVFHLREGFQLTWFDHGTRVIGPSELKRLYDPSRDYVVLPEDLMRETEAFPGRLVIFDKNAFTGLTALGANATPASPHLSKRVVAVLCVSEHNERLLRFVHPELPIYRVRSEIRPDLFRYRPLDAKARTIVMIAKPRDLTMPLFHALMARADAGLNKGLDFRWTFLGDRSESDTARQLQDALLLLFTSITEGLPRLPREALSCGCVVAAFKAGPLSECLPAAALFEYGDLAAMARFAEDVMDSYPTNVGKWRDLVDEGRAMAAGYSPEEQETSVLAAWEEITQSSRTWMAR